MRREGLFWGLVLIGLGAIFLMDNLGYFDRFEINVWDLVWPAGLILVGGFILISAFSRGKNYKPESMQVELRDTRVLELDLNHGAGELKLSAASPDSTYLASGTFTNGVVVRERREGAKTDLKLSPPDSVFSWMQANPYDWDLQIHPEVDLELDYHSGADKAGLDLRQFRLIKLDVETGASETVIYLPKPVSRMEVEVECGAASVQIFVPDEVELMVRADTGISTVNLDYPGLSGSNHRKQTAGYDTAMQRIEIKLDGGAASFSVNNYNVMGA